MKIKNYLSSSNAFSGRASITFSWLILFLWTAIVIFVSFHHEIWRDEARGLYVALSADSIWDLPGVLKNEGHPILWYLILWLGYNVIQTPVILKIISVFIGGVSAFLFFRFSPFVTWFKILFIFSFLPFYEYTVMARNYGISMLLFFLFAALYPNKKNRSIILAVILFSLANTNIHSAIAVCFLTLFWLYDLLFVDKVAEDKTVSKVTLVLAFCTILLGVLFSVITVIPDENSIVMQTSTVTIPYVLHALTQVVLHPGTYYHEIFPGAPDFVRHLLIVALALGLLVRPFAGLIVLFCAIVLGLFFSIGYSGSLRHQGIFFVFVMTLYWIVLQSLSIKNDPASFSSKLFKIVLYGVISAILTVHVIGSYKFVMRDVTQQMSSSKMFGQFLNENDQFHDAIVIGEPDIRLESLPYYASNRIFVPRTDRYENVIKLTKDNKQILSLGELLDKAIYLQRHEHKPVLIALGHFGLDEQNPPYVRKEQYERKFTWTDEELRRFVTMTEKVAEFKEDVKNERYEIYWLKNSYSDQKLQME